MRWPFGALAALLLALLPTPAAARYPTPFAEAASAAPIIIRARVEAIAKNDQDSADFQVKIVRTFVRSFAARHRAHTDLYPGQLITLSGSPQQYQKGHEYLILLSGESSHFSVENSCGTISSQEVILGLVPGFSCPARLPWTVSEVEARLTQPSVCPEQGYSTYSEPRRGLSGPPEVLTLEESRPRGRRLPLLGTLWLGLALGAVTFVFLRQRRLAEAGSITRS